MSFALFPEDPDFYGEGTLTAEEAEEGCQTGDGYGLPVYWSE